MGDPRIEQAMVEEREELIVSLLGDSKPLLRTAHFLKPNVTSEYAKVTKLLPMSLSSSLPSSFEPKEWPLKVSFRGLQFPKTDWVSWVDNLRPKYESVWKDAGIYEAILSSTCKIRRYEELLIGLAEKWCPSTNTFVFPWGESTITLEDVMVLGGFSVLGDPVLFCTHTDEHEAESAKDQEHKVFLSSWLTRFVFLDSQKVLKKLVSPVAACLARGKRLALAPAVLATIYKDLSLLKETIVGLSKFRAGQGDECVLETTLWSPFHLIQLWAWERLHKLQPNPKIINRDEPRARRWDNLRLVKVENIRSVLDLAGETFQWRPFARTTVHDSKFHMFYTERGKWVSLEEEGTDKELFSFAICLRATELVGPRCIEQYLPHRVAMQFGFDQDLPFHVDRCNDTPEIAWKHYFRPFSATRLHVFEGGVTVRYLEWWKRLVSVQRNMINSYILRKKKRSLRKRSKTIPWVQGNKIDNDGDVPPGFTPNCKIVEAVEEGNSDDREILKLRNNKQSHDDANLSYDKENPENSVESNIDAIKKIASTIEERIAKLESKIAQIMSANFSPEELKLKIVQIRAARSSLQV